MKRAIMLVLIMILFFVWNEKGVAASSSWAVIDADTGRLLLGSNEHLPLPIASLTKVWTALTVLDSNVSLKEEVVISSKAASSEGSSIYMKQGTKINVESLLYGLMLRSGNDAAHALAEHVGESVEGFVHMMNEKALYYGLEHTYFTNPSGLHEASHLSTAYETALMMRYAMQNKHFKKIASTSTYQIKMQEETYHWKNKHRLVNNIESAIAGKTGFTKAAGRTLVTYFEKDDKRIIVVTLNDGNDWANHLLLSEKAFSTYKKETVAKQGVYKITPSITGKLKQPIHLLLREDEKQFISHQLHIPRHSNQDGQWIVYFKNNPIFITNFQMTSRNEFEF